MNKGNLNLHAVKRKKQIVNRLYILHFDSNSNERIKAVLKIL